MNGITPAGITRGARIWPEGLPTPDLPAGEARITLFCGVAVAVAAGIVAAATSQASDWHPLMLVLLLAAFEAAGQLMSIRLARPHGGRPIFVNLSAPLALAITLLGPAPAAAIAAFGLLVAALRERTPPWVLAENLANFGVTTVALGLACRTLLATWGVGPSDPAFAIIFLVTYGSSSELTFLLGAAEKVIHFGGRIRDEYHLGWDWRAADGVAALLAAGTAYAYGTVGVGAVGLLAFVMVAYQYVITRISHIHELSASRGRLVGQVLQAEENERRRLAEELHHETLQELVYAQGLIASNGSSTEELGAAVERAVEQLRATILDLHPAVLRHAGLAAALDEVADHQAARGWLRPRIEIDPDACGVHDQLLFVLGREQLANAAKHAQASDVALSVARRNGHIVMEVSDNGSGMDASRRARALEHGHIGLASSAERVESLGGELKIVSAPGEGTRVQTILPAPEAGD